MSKVFVLRRDPVASDDETVGFKVGDVIFNRASGNRWHLSPKLFTWIALPVPGAVPSSGSHVRLDNGLGNWTWNDGSGILWG